MLLSNKSVVKMYKTKTWTIPEDGIHVCTSDLTEFKQLLSMLLIYSGDVV